MLKEISKSKRFQFVQLSLVLFLSGAEAWGSERVSLEKVLNPLQGGEQISKVFKEAALSAEQATALIKKNQAPLSKILQLFDQHTSFVRGEIESEKTLNSLMTYLQLSCLKIRLAISQSDFVVATEVLRSWFFFATDLPYEEASLVSLRTAAVIRSLLLDELEKIYQQKSSMSGHERLQSWLQQVTAPWPVDRVLLGESKRHLGKNSMAAAENLARQLQKNPYQSAKSLLSKRLVKNEQDRHFLEQLWRDSDIQSMREEITRIGILQAKSAVIEFERVKKQTPKSMQELLDAGLLLQLPVNYNTGRELQISEAILPSAAKH